MLASVSSGSGAIWLLTVGWMENEQILCLEPSTVLQTWFGFSFGSLRKMIQVFFFPLKNDPAWSRSDGNVDWMLIFHDHVWYFGDRQMTCGQRTNSCSSKLKWSIISTVTRTIQDHKTLQGKMIPAREVVHTFGPEISAWAFVAFFWTLNASGCLCPSLFTRKPIFDFNPHQNQNLIKVHHPVNRSPPGFYIEVRSRPIHPSVFY